MATDRTEQEIQELKNLKANSAFDLPDDAAKSGWTSAQIKEKFYAGLFYLYKLFKELRSENDTFTDDVDNKISQIQTDVDDVLTNLVASHDVDGNEIVTTYAKIANITNGGIAALKYIKANGSTENIRKIAEDLETFSTSINALFNNGKAKNAEVTDFAKYDINGRSIHETYATVTALQTLTTAVNNLITGVSIANKALNDSQGNVIHTTYVKKSDVVNSTSDTSTDRPLSAYQGKVLKDLITGIQNLLLSNDTDLDTIQEIVTYIKSNKSLIDSITTAKVSVADIVDNLTSQLANKPLSAKQGYVLKGMVDDILTTIGNASSGLIKSVNDISDKVDQFIEDYDTTPKVSDLGNGRLLLTYEDYVGDLGDGRISLQLNV